MGYDRWYLHVDADERLVFDGAPAAGRPGRGLADLVAFAAARGLRRLRGMLVDLYPPGPAAPPEARDRRGAPAGRAARCSTPRATARRSASSGSRARAGRGGAPSASTPSSPSTRCSSSAPARWSRARTTCTPTPRTTARTASSGSCTTSSAPASAPRPSAPPPRATTGGQPRVPRDPRRARPRPRPRRWPTRQPALPPRPADLVAAGLIAPIPWAGRAGPRPGSLGPRRRLAPPAGGGARLTLRRPASEPAARGHQPEPDQLGAALVAQAQALGVELGPPPSR